MLGFQKDFRSAQKAWMSRSKLKLCSYFLIIVVSFITNLSQVTPLSAQNYIEMLYEDCEKNKSSKTGFLEDDFLDFFVTIMRVRILHW